MTAALPADPLPHDPMPGCALPGTPLADALPGINACVHCGFCLQACPTYLNLEDENDSPRGRIFLMRSLLEGTVTPNDASVRQHIDQCLSQRCSLRAATGSNARNSQGIPADLVSRALHSVRVRAALAPETRNVFLPHSCRNSNPDGDVGTKR
jgi:ferredoxin